MLISQADLARAAGVSRKTVTEWKARGTVVVQGKLVDVAKTVARLRQHHREGAAIADRVMTALGAGVTRNVTDQKGDAKLEPDAPTGGGGEGDCYPCRDHLHDPGERALVAVLPATAYQVGGVAALAAFEAGLPAPKAEKLRLQVTASAMELVALILEDAGIAPPREAASWGEAALFDGAKVATVDWAKVEAETSTPR